MPFPEEYDVTITIAAHGATLKLHLPGIKRSDIMAPEYQNVGVTAAVKILEATAGFGADVVLP